MITANIARFCIWSQLLVELAIKVEMDIVWLISIFLLFGKYCFKVKFIVYRWTFMGKPQAACYHICSPEVLLIKVVGKLLTISFVSANRKEKRLNWIQFVCRWCKLFAGVITIVSIHSYWYNIQIFVFVENVCDESVM